VELGFALNEAELDKAFERFKALADKKKNIYDEDLHALVAEDVYSLPSRYELVSLEFRSGTGAEPWARVRLRIGEEERTAEATGNGAVNAVILAIKQCSDNDAAVLEEYRLDALTGGADAQARATLVIFDSGLLSRGVATHIDVVTASALAFVDALNHQARRLELQANHRNSVPPPAPESER
jgi:2-isopropylmalate synthase